MHQPIIKHEFKIGDRYSRWTVIGSPRKVITGKTQKIVVLCKCECGLEKYIQTRTLYSKQSAGCIKCARNNRIGVPFHTHLMSKTKEFRTWDGIKARCYNKNSKAYKNYGGRGIKMADQWVNSFENFFAYVGTAPSKHHSIDRHPNKNGNYEPGNVRWATRTEQNNNTRKNVYFTMNGETLSLAQWCDKLNISKKVVYGRKNDLGWSIEKALTTPIDYSLSKIKERRTDYTPKNRDVKEPGVSKSNENIY